MTASESLAVGAMADGTVVFYNPDDPAGIRRLGPVRDDLSDLAGYVRIPTLSEFVRERLGAEGETEERP